MEAIKSKQGKEGHGTARQGKIENETEATMVTWGPSVWIEKQRE